MDSQEKMVKNFLEKSDKDLLLELEKNTLEVPQAALAKAVLTQKLNTNISELKVEIKNLNKSTKTYSRILIGLTIAMLIGLAIQVWFIIKQTNYTEMQSRSERIQQAMSINSAVRLCEGNPDLEESGLFDLSGKSASCKEVLQIYK